MTAKEAEEQGTSTDFKSARQDASASGSLLVRIAILLTLALLPIGLIAIVQTTRALDSASETYRATLQARTARIAQPERDAITEAFGTARALAATISILDPAPEACTQLMRRKLASDMNYLFVGYLNRDVVSTCNSEGTRLDFSDAERAAASYADPKSHVLFNPAGEATGESVIVVSEPVISPQGEFQGFVSVSFSSSIWSESRDEFELEGEFFFLTFSDTGEILTTDIPREEVAELLPEDAPLTYLDGPKGYSFAAYGNDGTARLYAVVPIVADRAYALAGWQAPAQAGLGLPTLGTVAFPLLMWLISIFVALYSLQRLVVRPIGSLSRRMRSFADGRHIFNTEGLRSAPAELREMGDTFELMADKILHDEADLENRLHERDVLLKEVHHRVKNNLQLMSSILNMQSRRETSPEVRAALRDMQERLASLATVHRGLYEEPTLSTVRADHLLEELLTELSSFGATDPKTEISMSFDSVNLVPDQAVPLAMLATEAFTNSLKHLERGSEGNNFVTVTLKQTAPDAARFEIVNSYAEAENAPSQRRLGTQLIDAFVLQLGGTQSVATDHGRYVISVDFPLLPFEPA